MQDNLAKIVKHMPKEKKVFHVKYTHAHLFALVAIKNEIHRFSQSQSKEKLREILAEGSVNIGNISLGVLFFNQFVSENEINVFLIVMSILLTLFFYILAAMILWKGESQSWIQ